MQLASGAPWRSLTVQNSTLSRVAQSIQKTGLGDLDEVYMSILPALSAARRLPDTSAVVDFVRQQTKEHEAQGKWKEAEEMYLWAFRACVRIDLTVKGSIKATAAVTEFLRSFYVAAMISESQQHPNWQKVKKEFESVRSRLSWELRFNGDQNVLRKLAALYRKQGREEDYASWVTELGNNNTCLGDVLPFGLTPLHLKVIFGQDYAMPSAYRRARDDLGKMDILGWTPLHYAVHSGDAAAVAELVDAGASWNSMDIADWTPLHYAAANQSFEPKSSPLGIAVNGQGRDGFSPLHCAARSGNLRMATILVYLGANVEIHDNLRRRPLHWAAYAGSLPIVRLLLSHGASARVSDDLGRTPLHLAAIRGEERVVGTLARAGEVDAKDGDLHTAMQMATLNGHWKVVEILLDNRANINAQSGGNGNALQIAAAVGT